MPAVNGAEIRRRRQRTGMKLGQFAEHAGVGYKHLANIECGRQRTASIEFITRVAAALGLGADDTEELMDPEPEGAAAA